MRLPEIGTTAPTFTLASARGTRIGLADYHGEKNIVLWFSKGLF